MRADLRFGLLAFGAGLLLGPVGASAQDAQATTNTPATDAVGPRELQNFSLSGRVTQQAGPPATPAPAPATPASPARRQRAATETGPPQEASTPSRAVAARTNPAPTAQTAANPASALAGDLNVPPPQSASQEQTAQPAPSTETVPEPTATLAPEHRLPLWPWLLAALALGGAGAWFVRHRRHNRAELAGGPQIDAFVAPESIPAPRRAAKLPAPEQKPAGIVSSALRPWMDINLVPLRCLVEDDKVTFEFAVNLINSGGARARDILVEASVYNAGPAQEQEIGAFFARPPGPGERIAAMQPMQQVTVQSALVAQRGNIQAFDVGGRQVFVPLIAFNVSYRTGNREGRTSAAFMLGRENDGEKLAPLRLDLGERAFAGLGARALPISVRK